MSQAIILNHVTYIYHKSTRFSYRALNNVSFTIPQGAFTVIVGPTGSGKSTLLQHLNGLLKPSSGSVSVGRTVINSDSKENQIEFLRQHVGLVFQIPEEQVFGNTVGQDIALGPRNFGVSSKLTKKIVHQSAKAVGINAGLLAMSPFDLSGGQIKRVAIAGILACRPQILILDEPTAGLDRTGAKKIMHLVSRLRCQYHLTVVMVTHQMDIAAEYATQVVVMKAGKLLGVFDPRSLFTNRELMKKANLRAPFPVRFNDQLKRSGIDLKQTPLTLTDLADGIAQMIKDGRSL